MKQECGFLFPARNKIFWAVFLMSVGNFENLCRTLVAGNECAQF